MRKKIRPFRLSHVKTDKVDARKLASLHAAGYLPQIGPRMRRRSGCDLCTGRGKVPKARTQIS